MMARLLPSLLFGPIAGVLADRYDRKRLMVTTDLARGVLFIGVAFSRDLVALFALTFLIECLSLLYMSAKDASLPVIVDRAHLAEANQLNLLVTYGPLPFGALAATAMTGLAALLANAGIIDAEPVVLALGFNAATFLISGGIIARVRLPAHGRRATSGERGGSESSGVLNELREGVAFIGQLPVVRSLILGVVGVAFGAGVVVSVGPEFVRTALGRAESDWFTLVAFLGVGLLVGIAAAPLLSRRFRKERMFPIFLALTGLIAAVIAVLPSFLYTLVAGACLGLAGGLSFVLGYTLIHESTTDHVRGKTFAAFYLVTRVGMFAALGLAPFLAGAIGFATLIVPGQVFSLSGLRITVLLAGFVGLLSAVSAGRGMYRALHDGTASQMGVSLPVRPERANGVLVALEGVEGSGKSTQSAALRARLEHEGLGVTVTREPGGPPVAERVRELLLDPQVSEMHPQTEALLYAAARAEHVNHLILPALEAGQVVLCDRYVDSSLAYQGVARGLGERDIREVNRWAVGGVLPDVVVLLDLEPDEGLQRVATRNAGVDNGPANAGAVEERSEDGGGTEGSDLGSTDERDRIEREGTDFHRRVRQAYHALSERDPDRFLVVDANGDPETVAARVREGLSPWLPLPGADGDGQAQRSSGAEPGTNSGESGRPSAGSRVR
jgi:dTMP kinase